MSKKKIITVFLLSISVFAFAQDKQLNKIEKYLEEGKYQKSIEKATDYIHKNKKTNAAPYFYLFFGYYKQYANYKDYTSLKLAARYLYKGMKKKDVEKFRLRYKPQTDSLHLLLKQYAYNYYEAGDKKAKPFYDYLAKIYGDTLKQYREVMEIIPEQKPVGADIVERTRAGEINQKDAQGRKQGKWTKVYPNGQTAYEAFFKDDRPIGQLKRYHENGKLSSLLIYSKKTKMADAQFFNEKGEKISEGKYMGKIKVGLWLYFVGNKKVKQENYNDRGLLHGEQRTYYSNGKLYDKKFFEKGKEQGVWEKYFDNGSKMLVAQFKDGKLHGTMKRYYKDGKLEVAGQYENDKKDGKWVFYGEEKGQKETVVYKDGKNVSHPDRLEEESEDYKKQRQKSKQEKRNKPDLPRSE